MKVVNLPTKFDNYDVTYNTLTITGTKGQLRCQMQSMQACTDYFTDWLMYPNKCPVQLCLFRDDPMYKESTMLLISFPNEINVKNFITFGLPLVHKIEKANKFKLTKVFTTPHKRAIIVIGSKLWMHSTYTYSLYMKLFRNFCYLKEKPTELTKSEMCNRDTFIMRSKLLWKICFSGNLRNVNKGRKFVHGWKNYDQGNHSNNGIAYSHDILTWELPSKGNWNYEQKINMFKNFTRRKNMLKLQEQLKDYDYALLGL